MTDPIIDLNILDDDGKLKMRYRNKYHNCKKEGLSCSLTYIEYCTLAHNAGIVSSQIGFHEGSDKYVLARYNDSGNYDFDNCRFITQKENSKEKKITEKCLNAMKKNCEIMNEYNKIMPSEEKSKRIKEGIKRSNSLKTKNPIHQYKNKAIGKNNHCYGSHWITNGIENKKLNKGEELPEGFLFGRI